MKSRVISFSSLAGALVFSAGIGFSRAHGAPAISMSSPTTDYVPMPAESSLRPPSEVLARSQGQAPAPAVKTAAVPVVSSFEESLPSNPSDAEIISSHILEVHLAPQAKETVPGENTALGAAMAEFRSNPETPASLEGFLKAYPNTRWRAAVLLNIGLAYRNQARWSKVMPIWEEAWQISQHESSEGMKGIADRSLGELVNIYARLGRMDDLRRLFAETKGREITGAGAILVRGARQGLGLMETHPEEGFRCGPLALARLYTVAHPNSPIPIKIDGFKSTSRGTNLDQVHEWSEELGLGFQVAYRNPGADVLVPSVINWKVGHYAALTAAEGGAYLSQDSTFGVNNVVTREAIDAEASGYFLVRTGALPAGWRPVSPDEAKLVFGKGNAGTAGPTPTANTASKAGGDSGATCGMTTYSFNSTNASLMLKDTPVGYRPPIGPAIEFTVNYSSLEPSDQSFVTNLGLGWSSQWLSYLHIAQNQASGTIVCFGPGGGELEFVGYNSSTGTFAPQLLSHDVLVKTSASSYTLNHADGSFDTYDLSDGSSTPNIFRTSSTDRFGNKVHYGYDSNLRLVSLTDAIGQVTTLQYGLTTDSTKGDFYRITKVSDPFGRSASFAYNSGVLTSITDVLGIQSSYTYGASAFVTSVTTPYGTTSFSTYGDGVHTVGITAKDALGGQEQLEWDMAIDPPLADIVDPILYAAPAGVVPSGFSNLNLVYRNTFFWSKKAMLDGPGDYNKAVIYHWLHDSASGNPQTGYVLESTKAPLENRVWRAYPGQPDTLHEGTSNLPSRIARILDDGSEQDSFAQYNSLGNLTQSVDPLGRTTTYTYAGNQIDLLSVTVANGSGQDLVASYTYNSQHLPLTATDAAGQTTTYTYNSFGELLTVTNAKNETTTLAYDSHGYLQQITGPVAGATTSFTYDGFGRVVTVTDAEGYTVATNYDAADRPTKVIFPDGTYTQTIYNRLDPEWSQDRLGRWTLTEYDALRHLVLVEDPLQRKTLFEHCTCGALIGMTDANGSRTTLTRDLQQRITQKTFADGTSISMAYESTTSRLKSRTDQTGQTTVYSYNRDDSLAGVSYPNAQVATPGVTYAYDPAYPRIALMTDGVGTTTYSYNPVTGSSSLGAGQLASVSGPLPSSTVSYTYDALGRVLTTSINGSANTTSAAYDSLGRVTSVSNPLGQFAYTYVDQTARVRSVSYPNGQVTNFQYYGNASSNGSGNGDQRLQSIQNLNSSGTNLSTFSYTYDSNGQITTWGKQWDSGSAASSIFGYDSASQLVSAYVRNPSTLATQGLFYSYDPAGNRTQEQIDSTINTSSYNSVNEYTAQAAGGSMTFAGSVSEPASVKVGGNTAMVDSSNNWSGSAAVTTGSNSILLVATDSQGNSTTKTITVSVSGGPGRTLTYDPNGNLLNNGAGQTYQWDAENRLVSISQASGVTGFVYDGSGHRVQETLNGQVTKQWVWCGSQPCEERDASSSVTKRFYAQGEQVSGVSYFYSKDHLGSIRELTDGTGAIRARYDYDPFGRVTKVAGDIDADFGFTGDYYHKISGLSLTLYRAYDPNLGRWLSRDPIGEAGGINLYGYCLNDPINFVDLLGLDVTVSVYPGENGNPGGHVDIRVNNNTPSGFAPAPGASTLDLLRDKPVPGMMEPTQASRKPETTVTIHTTPKQDAAIQGYIDRKTKNPGQYQISGPNCSTTVHNALSAGGIKSDYTMWPRDLIKSLQQK